MAKRQVFFSFRYAYDCWRAGQIRNMGKVSDDSTFSDNDWEEVKSKSDDKIKEWINSEMKMRSCLILLVGKYSSNRKWIDYEIEHAWEKGKGVLAIRIHGLKDASGDQTDSGHNPIEDFVIDTTYNYIKKRSSVLANEKRLSDVCKTYDPPYKMSDNVYNYIKDNIETWIDEAIEIRNKYPK